MLNYFKTHVFYLVLIAVGVFAGRAWLQEHDQRIAAEAVVKQNAITVADLRDQMKTTAAQAAKQVQVIVKTVAEAKTPAQVVTAIPQLTDAPLNARVAPDVPGAVLVDAQALVQEIGQCKQDAIQLAACTTNSATQEKIIATDEATIKSLKKPRSFFQKLGTGLKIALIAISAVEGVRIMEGKP